MKEYKCILIGRDAGQTADILNENAKSGWELVCSYSRHCYYLVMERTTTEEKQNGL